MGLEWEHVRIHNGFKEKGIWQVLYKENPDETGYQRKILYNEFMIDYPFHLLQYGLCNQMNESENEKEKEFGNWIESKGHIWFLEGFNLLDHMKMEIKIAYNEAHWETIRVQFVY